MKNLAVITMKRLTLFRNGSKVDGRVVQIPDAELDEVLAVISDKLKIRVTKLFTPSGGLIDDVELIRDDDTLYVSTGEPFAHICPTKLVAIGQENGHPLQASVSGYDWITLNVGGTYFTTTRSTLTSREQGSMLARMFADEEKHIWNSSVDSNGAYLIDRSPQYFEPILNYLRHGELVINKGIHPRGVLEEAKFFGIPSLVEILEARLRDEEPATDNTAITRREFILKLMNTPSNCELRCQGLNFAGANLAKLDLRFVNFKHAILRDTNLAGANLSCCNFERADMTNARLDGANLLGVKMLCVNLENANLKGCNFEDPAGSRANMEGANMKHVNLEGSHMAGVNLRVATLKNANLQNCDLRGAVLAGADLENCDLSGCDLQEANLRGANLKGAAFELMLNPLHMSQTVR